MDGLRRGQPFSFVWLEERIAEYVQETDDATITRFVGCHHRNRPQVNHHPLRSLSRKVGRGRRSEFESSPDRSRDM